MFLGRLEVFLFVSQKKQKGNLPNNNMMTIINRQQQQSKKNITHHRASKSLCFSESENGKNSKFESRFYYILKFQRYFLKSHCLSP